MVDQVESSLITFGAAREEERGASLCVDGINLCALLDEKDDQIFVTVLTRKMKCSLTIDLSRLS
jgi:hypothetical protein